MRVSKTQMAEHRRRILAAASRLFREKGFESVSVAEIMKASGLTHGGFYGHFASKEALIAEAIGHGPAGALVAQNVPGMAATYLTPAHRDTPARGCQFAALGSEAARLPAEARAALSDDLRRKIDALADGSEGQPGERRAAITAWAAMVGALTLARLSADPALSDEILSETRKSLGAA